jgi:hypothetical protein
MIRSFDIGGPASARRAIERDILRQYVDLAVQPAEITTLRSMSWTRTKPLSGTSRRTRFASVIWPKPVGHEEKTVRATRELAPVWRALPASMTCKHDFDSVEPWSLCGL